MISTKIHTFPRGLPAQQPLGQGTMPERGTSHDFLVGENSPALQGERDVDALLLFDDKSRQASLCSASTRRALHSAGGRTTGSTWTESLLSTASSSRLSPAGSMRTCLQRYSRRAIGEATKRVCIGCMGVCP